MLKNLVPALILGVSLYAADWAPIPPEVWAMKEDLAKGIKDAVILEDRTIIKNSSMERIYRVRILSESGRKAAEVTAFSEDCYSFNGRTVYPDGKTLNFDKRHDFKPETREVGDLSQKLTIVIPPGITGNCVVELSWKEKTNKTPIPVRLGFDAQFSFGSRYRTLLETVEIPLSFPWSYRALPGRTQKLDESERSGFRIFSAHNLPAFDQPPFSLSVSLDRPFFCVFYQPEVTFHWANEGQKDYWNAVGRELWKVDFESRVRKGPYYEEFRTKILQGISSNGPQALATQLTGAIEKEIVNVSHLTWEEAAKWPKKQKTPRSHDLESICELKIADGRGMVVLLYNLLKDAGKQPKIALLSDRNVTLFRLGIFNPWQATHAAVAIGVLGKGMLLLDPSQRFAAPGLVHPDFQGVQGLLLDPKNNWSAQPFTVPIQPAAFNQRRFEYTLEIGEEEDRFKVNAQFSGFPELVERRRYDDDEQMERNRKLKKRFEKQIQGVVIQNAEVQNAENPSANVAWAVEGTVERENGRQRHVLPFPGLFFPINIPDVMPAERTLPMVMPYLQIQSARCSIKIPKGYKIQAGQLFEQRNSFGTVAWSAQMQAQGEETTAIVTLNVSVDSMFAPSAAYEGLKTYLGWIIEVYKRKLILEKI